MLYIHITRFGQIVELFLEVFIFIHGIKARHAILNDDGLWLVAYLLLRFIIEWNDQVRLNFYLSKQILQQYLLDSFREHPEEETFSLHPLMRKECLLSVIEKLQYLLVSLTPSTTGFLSLVSFSFFSFSIRSLAA